MKIEIKIALTLITVIVIYSIGFFVAKHQQPVINLIPVGNTTGGQIDTKF